MLNTLKGNLYLSNDVASDVIVIKHLVLGIKFPAKYFFWICHILKIDRVMYCNFLFMERPWYIL